MTPDNKQSQKIDTLESKRERFVGGGAPYRQTQLVERAMVSSNQKGEVAGEKLRSDVCC